MEIVICNSRMECLNKAAKKHTHMVLSFLFRGPLQIGSFWCSLKATKKGYPRRDTPISRVIVSWQASAVCHMIQAMLVTVMASTALTCCEHVPVKQDAKVYCLGSSTPEGTHMAPCVTCSEVICLFCSSILPDSGRPMTVIRIGN